MRKRFQEESLKKVDGRWVAQWWDKGQRKQKHLGAVSDLTKSEARKQLAEILAPINARHVAPTGSVKLRHFVENTYLPFYRRKWKSSTAKTNEDRLNCYLLPALGDEPIADLTRERLQDFLDSKAAEGLAFNTVAHMRWALRQTFRLAVNEGYLPRNTAELLFVPREAARPSARVMTEMEVKTCLNRLEGRERLIVKLALLTGLRPGEIFALRCGRVNQGKIEVAEGVYRNRLDTPRTARSIREVALPVQLSMELEAWIEGLLDPGPDAWVFPSERGKTPLAKDNVWRGTFSPGWFRLALAG